MSKLPKSDLDCYWSAAGRAESTRINPFTWPLNPAPEWQISASCHCLVISIGRSIRWNSGLFSCCGGKIICVMSALPEDLWKRLLRKFLSVPYLVLQFFHATMDNANSNQCVRVGKQQFWNLSKDHVSRNLKNLRLEGRWKTCFFYASPLTIQYPAAW